MKKKNSSKQFIKKLNKFTNNTFDVRIKWLTKNVKTLFKVKDKSLHGAYKIYKGVCACGESDIGETTRNDEVHWDQHDNPLNKSNSPKHIQDNLDQVLNW